MKTPTSSTPVLNFIGRGLSLDMLNRYKTWLFGYPDVHPRPHYAQDLAESGRQLAKRVLGPQNFCGVYGSNRCWVWERDLWVLYVSKRGMNLEVVVPEAFKWDDTEGHTALATRALEAFLTEWERPSKVP